MEDQKIDSNNEKKVNDNINKNLEILPEKKELIKKEINSNNNDNKNSIYEKFLFKNEDLYLSKENLQEIKIYDINVFNKIYISPDGNCLYHSISYHLFGTQDNDEKIRSETYNYLINNKTFIYEYCYVENNRYYLDIELGIERRKIKYFVEDYIENIKKSGFYGGFIELYILSKLYNCPIVILIEEDINGTHYYKKLMVYNNTTELEYKIQNIVYLLYENEDHYRYLEPNIRLIKFNKKNSEVINNISVSTTQKINNINNNMLNLSNKTLDSNDEKNIKNFNNEPQSENNLFPNDNKIPNIEKLNEDKKISKDNSINNIIKNNIKDYDKNVINSDKKEIDNNMKSKLIISEEIPFENTIYDDYINYCKNNRFQIKNNDKTVIEVPEFPILIGDHIKINYYNYIFNYLYIDKYNIKNTPKYPPYITQLKDLKEKDNKKRIYRIHAKTYYLDKDK